jgi:hypothetical protein
MAAPLTPEQQLAALQQQMAAMQAHMQQQAAAAAQAQHAPAAPVHHTPRPRIAVPSQYSGASGAALDGWLREMHQQFEWYQMTTTADQVRLACTNLRSTALDWWASLTPAESAAVAASWAAFEQALRDRFQPVNSAQTARLQLDSLRMHTRQTVQEYIAAFRRLLTAVPSMSEDDRVHRFVQGLTPPLRAHLNTHGVTTLAAAIAMAARVGSLSALGSTAAGGSAPMDVNHIDVDSSDSDDDAGAASHHAPDAPVTQRQLQQLLHAVQANRSSSARGRGNSRQAQNTRGREVHRNLPRIPHLTPIQVKEYMEAGKCFTCGSTEHRGRDCPKRVATAQSSN